MTYNLFVVIRVRSLLWDEFNSSHVAKHAVTVEEVEQVCAWRVEAWPGQKDRFLVVGKTKTGRIITIILARKYDKTFYPVTARDASRKERGWITSEKK